MSTDAADNPSNLGSSAAAGDSDFYDNEMSDDGEYSESHFSARSTLTEATELSDQGNQQAPPPPANPNNIAETNTSTFHEILYTFDCVIVWQPTLNASGLVNVRHGDLNTERHFQIALRFHSTPIGNVAMGAPGRRLVFWSAGRTPSRNRELPVRVMRTVPLPLGEGSDRCMRALKKLVNTVAYGKEGFNWMQDEAVKQEFFNQCERVIRRTLQNLT